MTSTPSRRRSTRLSGLAMTLALALFGGSLGSSEASSHREAPLSSQDPTTDLTDLYAFVDPHDPTMMNLIMNVIPFEEPAGGPNFHAFGDDVLYEFHIDNDGDAQEDLEYEVRFTTEIRNPNTFLFNTGPITDLGTSNWNLRQTYNVARCDDVGCAHQGWGVVAPPNIGPRSTPNYDALANSAIIPMANGGQAFMGPRDDPFFADLGSIFDLGGLRPLNEAHLLPLPAAEGIDYLAGYNVHTIALQVPIADLTNGHEPVIGIWANSYRQANSTIASDGARSTSGPFHRVSRLGMPLVNEVVVPLSVKDFFNSSHPASDGQFLPAVIEPELGALIPVLYPGVEVPTEVPFGLGTGGREDIATVFLTGIPGVNQPANVKPAEMLRVNTTTPSGFPNGRLLTDDTVDVSLQVVAGALADPNKAPNNALGDGVDANDVPFLSSFPYLAPPHQGYGG